ncbi:7753_t:CDS:2, partial [Ambispora gerdemannii]
TEFTRQRENKIVTLSMCNQCAEREKQNRLNKQLKAKSQDNENTLSLPLNDNMPIDADNSESSDDELLYEVCDLEELVTINFRNNEEEDGKVEFSIMIKIKSELVNKEILSLELDYNEAEKFQTMPVSKTSSSHSTSALISEHYEVIESRKAELMSNMKTFETLVKIINDDIENNKLYETYKAL